MKINWVNGSEIRVNRDQNEVVISANREGLLSLAVQLTALAEGVPGDQRHYYEKNAVEKGSAELIIERVE